LGWTRDQVLDQVDCDFLDDLHRAWSDWPPLRKFYAARHGHKPPERPSKDFGELMAMFPDGMIR
jgi:hypothetical protein